MSRVGQREKNKTLFKNAHWSEKPHLNLSCQSSWICLIQPLSLESELNPACYFTALVHHLSKQCNFSGF